MTTDQRVHCCKGMKEAGQVNDAPYSYRWEDHHGWTLYDGSEPRPDYRWCHTCDWCCNALPAVNDPMTILAEQRPQKMHRCIRVCQSEWHRKRAGLDSCYLIEWDGFEWIYHDDGIVIQTRLKACPYCNAELPNPRRFVNTVKIT